LAKPSLPFVSNNFVSNNFVNHNFIMELDNTKTTPGSGRLRCRLRAALFVDFLFRSILFLLLKCFITSAAVGVLSLFFLVFVLLWFIMLLVAIGATMIFHY
jgi:hypothetical protein